MHSISEAKDILVFIDLVPPNFIFLDAEPLDGSFPHGFGLLRVALFDRALVEGLAQVCRQLGVLEFLQELERLGRYEEHLELAWAGSGGAATRGHLEQLEHIATRRGLRDQSVALAQRALPVEEHLVKDQLVGGDAPPRHAR